MVITINTGNSGKFELAKRALSKYGISCTQQKIDTPEVQAYSSKEVSEFSAHFAYSITKSPVVVTDVSYHIAALNDFPGPFIKYINNWLSSEDLLKMMEGKKNRRVVISEFLTYQSDEDSFKTFSSEAKGSIIDNFSFVDTSNGSTIDQLLVRDGYDKPQNMFSKKEQLDIIEKSIDIWNDLGKYVSEMK